LLITVVPNRDPRTTVTFLIGPDEESFIIHKEHAVLRSRVLDRAFNSEFTEGQTLTYRLPKTYAGVFRYSRQYLYTEKISSVLLRDSYTKTNGEWLGHPDLESGRLLRLWILADYFQMLALQNLVIDTIAKITTRLNLIFGGHWRLIYEQTAVGSPLRRLAVMQACSGSPEGMARGFEKEDMVPEMMQDVILHLVSSRKKCGIKYETLLVPVPEELD
jgi:hypothetical protein